MARKLSEIVASVNVDYQSRICSQIQQVVEDFVMPRLDSFFVAPAHALGFTLLTGLSTNRITVRFLSLGPDSKQVFTVPNFGQEGRTGQRDSKQEVCSAFLSEIGPWKSLSSYLSLFLANSVASSHS